MQGLFVRFKTFNFNLTLALAMKVSLLFAPLLLGLMIAESRAQIGGAAAPFARMGFSARGVALGNAGGAVISAGELQPITILRSSVLQIIMMQRSPIPFSHLIEV